MQELQEIANKKVAEMVESGAIQESIESGIASAINKALASQFETYGAITKQIEKALEEGLKVNTKDLPFESYNEQMLVAIKTKMGNLFAGKASEKFMSEIDHLLAPVPETMAAKEFIETIVGYWKSDDPWSTDDLDDQATVEIEQESPRSTTYHTLKMWKQKEYATSLSRSTNSPDVHVYIIDGKIRIGHGHAYNPTCFAAHEAYIFKLYAAGTTITGLDDFDCDDCDLTLKEQDF